MEKKRLDYIDMAKGIGVLLVLIGHMQGDPFYSYSPYIQPLCVFIFSFHMPFFFILSGILMAIKNDDRKSLPEIARRRFRGIMVPYYWFSLFLLIYVLYYVFITNTVPLSGFFLNLWYVISGYGMNVLWFLPALYLGELLFIYLRQKFPEVKKNIVVLVVSCAIIFVISYLLTKINMDVVINKRIREFITVLLRPIIVSGFIGIGFYVRKLCESNAKLEKFLITPATNDKGAVTGKIRTCYIAIGLVLMVICRLFIGVNNGIDVRTLVFRNIFFFFVCALSGSFGLILICKGLKRSKILCFYGTGSLIFMATHNLDFILAIAIKTAMFANQYLTRARGYICYLIIFSIITLFCTLMIFVIQRYLPFILGKKYSKQN